MSDNIRVLAGSERNEYLSIVLIRDEKDFRIYVYRYAVPGRYDIYSFELGRSENGPMKVSYSSDSREPIAKSAAACARDLNKSAVVAMIKSLFKEEQAIARYGYNFVELLEQIASKSKAYQWIKRRYNKHRTDVGKRVAARMEERKKNLELQGWA
jgi:hypothetical protein